MIDRKKLLIILIFIVLVSISLDALAQCDPVFDPGCQDEPADVPIPGILYFLVALLGIGLKKIYNARKKD